MFATAVYISRHIRRPDDANLLVHSDEMQKSEMTVFFSFTVGIDLFV